MQPLIVRSALGLAKAMEVGYDLAKDIHRYNLDLNRHKRHHRFCRRGLEPLRPPQILICRPPPRLRPPRLKPEVAVVAAAEEEVHVLKRFHLLYRSKASIRPRATRLTAWQSQDRHPQTLRDPHPSPKSW